MKESIKQCCSCDSFNVLLKNEKSNFGTGFIDIIYTYSCLDCENIMCLILKGKDVE